MESPFILIVLPSGMYLVKSDAENLTMFFWLFLRLWIHFCTIYVFTAFVCYLLYFVSNILCTIFIAGLLEGEKTSMEF